MRKKKKNPTHTHSCLNSYLHSELRHFALAAWRGVTPLRGRTTCCGATEGLSSPTVGPPFSQIIFITRLFKVITGKAWGHPSQTQGHPNNLPTRWEIRRNYSLLPCWFPASDPFLKLDENWNSASLCDAIHLQTDHIAAIFFIFFALQSCCNSSPGAKARAPNQLKIQYLSTLRQNDTGPLTAPSVKTCLKPTMNQCDETSAHWSLGHGKHIDTHVAKWRNMENCAHCSPRICAKGYRHEWWSLGEFHNTRLKQVKSGSHNRAADPQWTPVYPLDQGNSQPQTKSLSYRFIFFY